MLHALLALLTVAASDSTPRLKRDSLEAVVIRATRTAPSAPQAVTLLDATALQRGYVGADLPLRLQTTVGATGHSESGALGNYSYLRVRGIDQTRLSISYDGVPLNDPEDQVLYFSNLPDLTNSLSSAQLQRGVGTSAFGTAAWAGALQLAGPALATAARGSAVDVTVGSFGTRRVAGELRSGVRGAWSGYLRATTQSTDGYRRQSGNDARSLLATGAWLGTNDLIKLTVIAGHSANALAYVAPSVETLERDRRANPLTPDERDRFTQSLISAQWSHAFSTSRVQTTAYRNAASGDYDVAIGSELWNFALTHEWYGVNSVWSASGTRWSVDAGAHLSTYARDHALRIRPALATDVYRNTGQKDEQSAFAKARWTSGRWQLFGDAQLRRASFDYTADRAAGITLAPISWGFFNPKVGAAFSLRPALTWTLSLARSGREPARNDLFGGFDNVDTTNAAFIGPLGRVRPERVDDLESVLGWAGRTAAVTMTAYQMAFRDEIAPIGVLSYIGLPLRKNVARSDRRGIEVDGRWSASARVTLTANVALQRARIAEYRDDNSGISYRDVPPLLSPARIANVGARIVLGRGVSIDLDGRAVSESFLANTGDARFTVPAAAWLDGGIVWERAAWSTTLRVANTTDARVALAGYTDGTTAYHFPLAARHLMLRVRWAR
ncbi:MAG: TonB-dependent receptor plug domain-containing protein [Gemmatimonadaceae bacterium]|nr:TonB-dependent receptor plug domain-containing protein [Gemmatimonadaceae bacterium]